MNTADTTTSSRWRRFAVWCAACASRVHHAAPRPIQWFLDNPARLTALAWMLGLLAVGSTRIAVADDIIVGPDLTGGGPKTLYETYDLWSYKLTTKPDDENSDWLGLSQGVLEIVGFINFLLLWLCLGLLYGGLTLLEWLLNLNLYTDSASQIDQAVQMVAGHVFWPLIAATTAVGAFMAYAKWRGDGRSVLTDLLWVIVAAVMGVGFAAGPSTFAGHIDGARQQLASGVIAGSTQFVNDVANPVGFPSPELSGDPKKVGTRKLVDSLWSSFGITPWCFAEFRSLQVCKEAGNHALANDETWQGWMEELDSNGSPAVFGDHTDYVRGQDLNRTGVLLLMVLVTVPLSWILVRLIISGLVAVVGFLLMLLIGAVFMALLPIPGLFRRMGVQYVISTVGMALMTALITLVVSALMVLTMVFGALAAEYGFFLVAILNLAAMTAALKAKNWLETLTTFGGGSSSGFATALIARSIARTVIKTVATVGSGGVGGVAGALAKMAPRGDTLPGFKRTQLSFGNRGLRKEAGLDSGPPIRAQSTRLRQPGNEPQLTPSGSPALSGGGASSNLPARRPAPVAGGGDADRARNQQPMAAARNGGGTAASSHTVSPADISDGHLHRNVADAQTKSGHRGRVWVAHPGGRGVAPLEHPQSPPREARSDRRGVYRVSRVQTGSSTTSQQGRFGRRNKG